MTLRRIELLETQDDEIARKCLALLQRVPDEIILSVASRPIGGQFNELAAWILRESILAYSRKVWKFDERSIAQWVNAHSPAFELQKMYGHPKGSEFDWYTIFICDTLYQHPVEIAFAERLNEIVRE